MESGQFATSHKSELVRINANVKRYPGARLLYAAV